MAKYLFAWLKVDFRTSRRSKSLRSRNHKLYGFCRIAADLDFDVAVFDFSALHLHRSTSIHLPEIRFLESFIERVLEVLAAVHRLQTGVQLEGQVGRAARVVLVRHRGPVCQSIMPHDCVIRHLDDMFLRIGDGAEWANGRHPFAQMTVAPPSLAPRRSRVQPRHRPPP